ncbi:hypothetical protein [Ornithinibacillus contaminans]|uniref:hypothetical protein n=1 Tax=Ornithinibacillus contaminans TaxID=694055 RepID=UPI00064D9EC5|nr:hypothetical protein [Ornithinibacillus contaminans]
MEQVLAVTEEEIKRYYELNRQKKAVEEEMTQLKKKFHALLDTSFGKQEKGEIQRGNYKLQRQIRTTTSYDDQGTIAKLAELNLREFIIEKEIPDTEKLESAIKLGLVEESDFAAVKKEKITQTIVVRETFNR